jgi:hypothetical protein
MSLKDVLVLHLNDGYGHEKGSEVHVAMTVESSLSVAIGPRGRHDNLKFVGVLERIRVSQPMSRVVVILILNLIRVAVVR